MDERRIVFMNNEINEMYNKINELMKASNNFDIQQYEQTFHELEMLLGKEIDRSDETKTENTLATNIQETILRTLEGKATLDMISIVEQIITQAGGEYKALKTKYMNDGIGFFIDHMGVEDDDEPEQKTSKPGKKIEDVIGK